MNAPAPAMRPAIAIDEAEFQKFREYFYRRTGIFFEDDKRYFVDKRLIERVQATGAENFRAYFMMLRFETAGTELQTLVNLMTVNETYFFREEYQFQCLVNSILPEIVATRRPGDRIRIWSMPSSSGEEPYSIAMYLLEHWPDVDRYDVEIIASDIDTRILASARRGLYASRVLQNLPLKLRTKYFRPAGKGDEFQIIDELRESVEFTRVNLSDRNETRGYREFDVVFCRNLLIYFDDVSRAEAAATFFDALNPGGFICLGHSESMSRISALYRVRKFPDAIVYQKPL
jgi:chemotaxis protein methyltransferase CheR